MNKKLILQIMGRVLVIEAALMALPMLVALIYRENPLPFLAVMAITGAVGALLWRVRPEHQRLFARDGFVTVALSWILLTVFGALPYVFSGCIPNYIDAVFETISGLSTTGSSILADVESLSRSCHFWRCFTQWIGGMGVLVFILAVLPMSGEYSMHIMRAEVPGPVVGKLVPRARKTAMLLYLIYIAMTLALAVLLLFGGMDLYDALVHAFTTASTGGFSPYSESIAAFHSPYIEWVLAVAMLFFSINFNLYFLILIGRVRAALRSEELWWFLGIVLFSAVTVAFNVRSRYEGMNVSFRYALFQVATIISTTGFATANFNLWPGYSKWLLVTLMLTGGCAGSTCGGIKLSRLLIMGKAALGELRGLLQPRSVSRVRLDGRVIDSRTVSCSFVFFFIYMALIFIGTLLVSLDGYDAVTSLTSVVTCLSNVGPGLSLVGPVGTFDIYSWPVKLLLSLLMLLGRLELFPVLLLFAPPARALRRRGR